MAAWLLLAETWFQVVGIPSVVRPKEQLNCPCTGDGNHSSTMVSEDTPCSQGTGAGGLWPESQLCSALYFCRKWTLGQEVSGHVSMGVLKFPSCD